MAKLPKTVDEKPTAIRLKELKPLLQREACEMDRSMNWLIRKIIKEYYEHKKSAAK